MHSAARDETLIGEAARPSTQGREGFKSVYGAAAGRLIASAVAPLVLPIPALSNALPLPLRMTKAPFFVSR
jgi:hypothetical protein